MSSFFALLSPWPDGTVDLSVWREAPDTGRVRSVAEVPLEDRDPVVVADGWLAGVGWVRVGEWSADRGSGRRAVVERAPT